MNKIDFKKELKHLYGGKVGENVLVDVPSMQFLMVDGQGSPNTSDEFKEAIEALYPVAYTLKFTCKADLGKDYGVMPLEGRFWTEDDIEFNASDKDSWQWTLMVMQPDFITKDMVDVAVDKVREKKNPPALDKLRFETLEEGHAAQVMYVGPYADESPTIQELHQFIADQGGELSDNRKTKHHEIYLSDARRTDPSKLKTVIRQPFLAE